MTDYVWLEDCRHVVRVADLSSERFDGGLQGGPLASSDRLDKAPEHGGAPL